MPCQQKQAKGTPSKQLLDWSLEYSSQQYEFVSVHILHVAYVGFYFSKEEIMGIHLYFLDNQREVKMQWKINKTKSYI